MPFIASSLCIILDSDKLSGLARVQKAHAPEMFFNFYFLTIITYYFVLRNWEKCSGVYLVITVWKQNAKNVYSLKILNKEHPIIITIVINVSFGNASRQ